MGTVKMGKNKNKKQNEPVKASGTPKETTGEPSSNFVPIVSCFYCDEVSFDVDDQENYSNHLQKAHNINKNNKALLDVTLQLQSVDLDLKTSSKDDKNCDKEENKKSIQEDVDSLPETESKTALAVDAEPKSSSIPVENLPDARIVTDEAPKTVTIETKPAFAGLPIDDSASDWMDDDIGCVMEDEETNEDEKPDCPPTLVSSLKGVAGQQQKSAFKEEESAKAPVPIAPPKDVTAAQVTPAFAGLPIDDSTDSWMDDDVGQIIESEDEDEERVKTPVPITPPKDVTAEQPKPAFAGLPIDEAADSWMDDDVGIIMDSEEEEEQKAEAAVPIAPPKVVTAEQPKPAFAGLPIDDSTDSWMNDEEEEKPKKDKLDSTKKVIQVGKVEEDKKSKDEKPNPKSDNKTKPKIEKPKRKEKSPKQQVENSVANKQEKKKDSTSVKNDVQPASNVKPSTIIEPKKETVAKKSNIDSILDDWLKGSEEDANDDTIPDELPEIDDAIDNKNKKADVKSLKSDKINTVLSDMSQISNIISKDSNTGVKNAIDDWFSGGADQTEKLEDNKTTATKQENSIVVKKEENTVPCGDCAVCGKIAKAICTGCKHVFYCSRDHQRKHWSSHKDECKSIAKLPYRVERSNVMGRYLIATKDMEEGELILNESPMVVGPRQLTKPVCLGCHKEITSTTPFIKCIRCNWPVCSERCQDSPQHDAEGRATKAAGSRIKVEHFDQINMMYACITILRALALVDGPRKIWEDYTKFDSHLQERIKTPVYNKVNKEKVVFFIHQYLNIQRYSDLEILEACGKLDTNCFEIKQNGLNLRAMYRTACIMSHHCKPNTRHTFDPDNAINIYSTRQIKKGEIICATYTNSLWSTIDRRDHLQMSKCFWCTCDRCSDPTEYNSYLSSIRCSRCAGFQDHIQDNDLQFLLPEDPLNAESNWRCQKCTNIQKSSQIKAGNMTVSSELKELDRSRVSNMVNFLTKYENMLGPNNHHVVEIKFAIVMMLGNRKPYTLENLTQEELEMKERIAAQLIDLADKIEPGSSKWRGQLLLELQMAQISLAAGLEETGAITRFAAKEKASIAMENLKNAARILQVEPDMRPILQDRMAAISAMLAKWEE